LVENYQVGLVDAMRKFGSVDTGQLTALRLFTREVTEGPFRCPAAVGAERAIDAFQMSLNVV
jgi:hypothetical protein